MIFKKYAFPESTFSVATEARVLWAHMRIAITAGESGQRVTDLRAQALAFAEEHALRTCTGPVPGYCPFLDVDELIAAWHAGFRKACRSRGYLTADEMDAMLAEMAESANRGCGLVYELFAERFSGSVDSMVEGWSDEARSQFIALANNHGYCSREERDAADSSRREEGLCSHFLDAQTCPCGCFEGDDDYFYESPGPFYPDDDDEDGEQSSA
ncbi:hypothetical protein [Burkholderia gladioli]|uniref:hypothetical protein n=1 Tax=Burkholderia gladioli TaxID=28095 RepID=UPI001641D32B|nr:hypothetical protein [Burkholderia gladioli]